MHLSSRRAGHGSDDADLGFDPLELEGDDCVPPPDEGAALFPFAQDIPLSGAAPLSTDGTDGRVLARVRDLEGLGRRLDAIMVLRQALGEEQGNVRIRLRLAELLEAGGEGEAALESLAEGVRATRG